jgi:Flp pilus assembly protein TadB
MLYLFLGSTLLGSLSTALLLWRKSVVQTELSKSQASDKDSQERANRAVEELGTRSKAYEDQLQLQRNQVDQLRKERDFALDALAKNTGAGSIAELLRMQHVPQMPSDPKGS